MLLLLLTVLVVSQKLVKRRHSYCELLWDSFVFVAAIYKLAIIIGEGCIKIQDSLEHTQGCVIDHYSFQVDWLEWVK